MFKEMTEEDWVMEFRPIENHIDANASFEGHMFETYGDEEEFVRTYPDPNCIWTYADGDDGGTYIFNGWHFVNRIGYFITEVPCPVEDDIQISVIDPEEEEFLDELAAEIEA